jgi:branched-chain amino acid transport system permease protein
MSLTAAVLPTIVASVSDDLKSFPRNFFSLTVNGVALGSLYALIALGYTLVYGVLRLINFAHSEVFMIGTFGSLIASTKLLGLNSDSTTKTGFTLVFMLLVILMLAMVVSGIGAVALERAAYRPLRGSGDIFGAAILAFAAGVVVSLAFTQTGWYNLAIAAVLTPPIGYVFLQYFKKGRQAPRLAFLISAIGASTALSEAVGIWGPKKREFYATPRILKKTFIWSSALGERVRLDFVVSFTGAILMMTALTLFVTKTRLGRGVRAVAQDAETSRILGVNVDRIIMVTFILGGVMAGAGAALYTLVYENAKNDIGFRLGVKSFTAAVLGGIGNLKGALLGGLALGLIETYGAHIFGGKWQDVIAFSILLVVLMFRPTGLLGESLGRARA